MMYEEFLKLTNRKVSYETYTNKIEPLYMDSFLGKQEFCKQYIEQTAKPRKQKEGNNYSIEIQRHNVTLSQFLNYIKTACKNKGIYFEIDKEEFENPTRPCNISYYVKDGKKIYYDDGYKTEWDASDAPCQSEICKIKPLDYQTYILNFDGSMYNEICEFTFWDEKTGTGYYYQANREKISLPDE